MSFAFITRVASEIAEVSIGEVSGCPPPSSTCAFLLAAASPEISSDPLKSVVELASRNLSAEAESAFLYTCDETAEITEPIAAPMSDPATPITEESKNTVAAASAPAMTCAIDRSSNSPRKNPCDFPVPTDGAACSGEIWIVVSSIEVFFASFCSDCAF